MDMLKPLRGLLSPIRDAALTLFLPTLCHLCGALIDSWDDGIACADCWSTSLWPSSSQCTRCGLPPHSPFDDSCPLAGSLAFAEVRACGPYVGAWRESVLWLKSHPQLAPRISRSLRDAFVDLGGPGRFDSIIPVPLHALRERERGFNQAQVIAQELARSARIPIDTGSLVRTAPTTRHRAGMDAQDRAQSMRHAFRVRASRRISGRCILIVDDVMTTAATANEIASVLIEEGAREAGILTIARVTTAPLWGKPLAQVRAC